jgi:hypothetical protein
MMLSLVDTYDMQARSMAARNSRTARWGNIIAGLVLMGFSVPFGLLGSYSRKYHGPDSPYAEFAADTCSAPLGLPSCAQWLPDDKFVLFKYLWERVPRVGALALFGVYESGSLHRDLGFMSLARCTAVPCAAR